jgi:amino-acid N-acetyltransferase
MRTREALLPDAEHIYRLISNYSGDGTLLPRTFPEICENVRDFVVLERDRKDRHGERGGAEIIGCGALHLYGPHLAEIRSITVDPRAAKAAGAPSRQTVLPNRAPRVDLICLFTPVLRISSPASASAKPSAKLPDESTKTASPARARHSCDEVAMISQAIPTYSAASFFRPPLVTSKHEPSLRPVRRTPEETAPGFRICNGVRD